MAAVLDRALSQYLQATSAVRSEDPIAVSLFVRPDANNVAQAFFSIGNSSTTNRFWEGAFNNSGTVRVRKANITVASATGGTIGTAGYHHLALEFDNADASSRRRVGLDGVFGSPENTSVTDGVVDRTVIGALHSGATPSLFFGGHIAEVAIFSRLPTADEWALLAQRVYPNQVIADALVDYWPLLDGPSSAVGGIDLTAVSGASFDSGDHPAMIDLPAGVNAWRDLRPWRAWRAWR